MYTPFGGYGGPKQDQVLVSPVRTVLIPLPSDAACQLDIFRHDCDSLRMNGA